MKRLKMHVIAAGLAAACAMLPAQANAYWLYGQTVTGVRSAGTQGFITLLVAVPGESGCANKNHVFVPAAIWNGISSVGLAALLSGRSVDVSATGCSSDGFPVLTMLVIK